MKCFKKVAALLFCVALALSVMAVGAMAEDDTAELLSIQSTTDFVVTLTKASTSSTIGDRDNVSGYEINATDDITFDINLAYTGTGSGAFTPSTDTINGFQFTFDTDNSGSATVDNVTIKSGAIAVASSQANTYAYTAAGSSANDIAISATATSIGTITFSFDNATQNTAISPKIKDILIQVRGTETTYQPADASTEIPVYVNPVYTVTVNQFQANSTTGVAEPTSATSTVNGSVTYNFTTGGTLTNETAIPGYTFQGWMVVADTNVSSTWAAYDTTASGAWAGNVSYLTTTTDWSDSSLVKTGEINFIAVNTAENATTTLIPAGQVGVISLTPVYTADVYTVTFVSGDEDATFGASTDTVEGIVDGRLSRTATYTIETIATDGTGEGATDTLDIGQKVDAKNGKLARTGFKFAGWVPSSGTSENGYVWTTDSATTTLATNVNIITEPSKKHIGNVTLTAAWELDIYFAKIGYQYAGSTGAMILVGVPSGTGSNYNAAYTYKCNDGTTDQAMFIIPAGNQRTGYVGAVNATTYTAFTSTNLTDTYVLYAYIAPNSTTDISDITLVEGSDGNTTIAYDGDVDESDTVNVGDFGNVDTLLSAVTNTTVFAITSSAGVQARLQADKDTTADKDAGFGSIADVKAIYNAMGYSLT